VIRIGSHESEISCNKKKWYHGTLTAGSPRLRHDAKDGGGISSLLILLTLEK
jgi:hypothetical protein